MSVKTIPFFMKKSQKHVATPAQEMTDDESTVPAIVCEYFNKDGVFEEMRVATASEVLDAPEKYDSRTFALLIRNLGRKLTQEYGMADQLKCTQVIIDLAEELESRIKEEKDAREKLETEVKSEPINFTSNWQKKKEYFMGKSVKFLPIDKAE